MHVTQRAHDPIRVPIPMLSPTPSSGYEYSSSSLPLSAINRGCGSDGTYLSSRKASGRCGSRIGTQQKGTQGQQDGGSTTPWGRHSIFISGRKKGPSCALSLSLDHMYHVLALPGTIIHITRRKTASLQCIRERNFNLFMEHSYWLGWNTTSTLFSCRAKRYFLSCSYRLWAIIQHHWEARHVGRWYLSWGAFPEEAPLLLCCWV